MSQRGQIAPTSEPLGEEPASGTLKSSRSSPHKFPVRLALAYGVTNPPRGRIWSQPFRNPGGGLGRVSRGNYLYAHLAHGVLCLRRGDPGKAIPPLERARELCEGWNLRLALPVVASYLGLAYARSERIPHALPLLEHGGEATLRAGLSLRMTNLGEGYWRAGRSEDATACARQALQVAREQKERGNEAYALHLLGEIAAQGDPPEGESAGAHFRQALALAGELGMRPLQAHCHLGLGKLYRRTGDRKQAQQHLTMATAMYREMDMRFWLEQAKAELSQRSRER